jgi:hypothetical protein
MIMIKNDFINALVQNKAKFSSFCGSNPKKRTVLFRNVNMLVNNQVFIIRKVPSIQKQLRLKQLDFRQQTEMIIFRSLLK